MSIHHVVGRVLEQNVLRLQVCVGQSVGVEEVDGLAEVVGDRPHVLQGVGVVGVVPQEVEYTLPQNLERYAGVATGKFIYKKTHFVGTEDLLVVEII